jgi:hypothetical protein
VKRREFITLLGGAAAWPVVARSRRVACRPSGYWVVYFVRTLVIGSRKTKLSMRHLL